MRARLCLNAAGHFLVDALCAAALFGPVAAAGGLAGLLLLYNTLAFTTQCAVGLVTDRLRRHESLAALALAAVALGVLLPLPAAARVVVVGLGNSLFHVAGGTVTLAESGGRAGPLGLFVAPGAAGLALGTLWPRLGGGLALAALPACLAMLALERGTPRPPAAGRTPWLAVVALLLAVAVRAIGGSAVAFPWKTGAAATLLAVAAVCLGKAAGGYACDRLGPARTALWSLPAAALLAAFCGAWMLPSLLGQGLVNLTMPVTLWLLYRAMPDAPGLAFGLAASMLWPGTLAGGLIRLTGPWRAALVLLSFAFGLAAVLYAAKKTPHKT